MTFISYAQNYEDVMLWRALKHIKKGFYIDIGAAWPDQDSVTKAFYVNGWRGINIEPNPEHYALLASQRPHDVNLMMAVGNQIGKLTINFFGATGLSTAIDESAEQHESAGWARNRQEVQLTTLEAIFRMHINPNQPIHFLKVDVEGFEENVLRGNDWEFCRPWIVVVEATLPTTQTESYESWEPILLEANYSFLYADGLNRFYLASEHRELLYAFKYPPNIFDGFLLNSQQKAEVELQQAEAKAEQAEAKAEQAEAKAEQAEAKAEQAEAKAEQAEAKAEQAEAKAEQAEAKAEQAEAATHQHTSQLNTVFNSTSWRITAPLRWPVNQWRLLYQFGLIARIKALAKKVLRKLVPSLMARPELRIFVTRMADFFGMAERLKPFVRSCLLTQLSATENEAGVTIQTIESVDLHNLSPRARQIFADLKAAIEKQKKV